MMFIVCCPHCKHEMKYESRNNILTGKIKKCVYCGKSINVKDNWVKRV